MTAFHQFPCFLCASALAVLVALPAVAEPIRQHAPHVHGEATGNLSLDDDALRLELTIPGVNLVGFEHPPRDEAQQTALTDTLAFLNSASWVALHDAGRCELASVNAHTHGFSETDAAYDDELSHEDHHDHAHSHDHGHPDHQDQGHAHHDHDHRDHDHHGHDHDHEHAEFHLVVNWECQRPDALNWIDIDLFSGYAGNERMVIDVLTHRTASRERLQPNRIRINL